MDYFVFNPYKRFVLGRVENLIDFYWSSSSSSSLQKKFASPSSSSIRCCKNQKRD